MGERARLLDRRFTVGENSPKLQIHPYECVLYGVMLAFFFLFVHLACCYCC